jgi:hypothetical protein
MGICLHQKAVIPEELLYGLQDHLLHPLSPPLAQRSNKTKAEHNPTITAPTMSAMVDASKKAVPSLKTERCETCCCLIISDFEIRLVDFLVQFQVGYGSGGYWRNGSPFEQSHAAGYSTN